MSVARVAATALAGLGLAACGPAATTTTSSSAPASAAAAPPTAAATMGPSPGAPPAITVVAAGASAANTGMVGVAVIRDGAAQGASDVTVTFTAASSNGKAPVTATATLAHLNVGETQAVVARLAVPGDDTVSTVTAAAVAAAASSVTAPEPTATGAAFTAAGYSETVTASVGADRSGATQVEVVAVCYSTSNQIVGGGVTTLALTGAGSTRKASIPVDVASAPDHVEVYAHPAS